MYRTIEPTFPKVYVVKMSERHTESRKSWMRVLKVLKIDFILKKCNKNLKKRVLRAKLCIFLTN